MYKQSQKIEQRLAQLLDLLETAHRSSPDLAAALNVSMPTVSRSIAALRGRGHDIRAIKRRSGWSYAIFTRRILGQAEELGQDEAEGLRVRRSEQQNSVTIRHGMNET